ncbi:unnamed protein product, partial [Brenthis ino]
MMTENFKSIEKLEKLITNRKIDNNTDKSQRTKVEWLKIQWLRFTHDNPYKIYYKYTNSNDETFSPFNCFDIEKKRTRFSSSLTDINLDVLYPNGRPIEKKKYEDLLQLLPYVPPIRHDFYRNLKTNNSAQDTEADFYDDDLTQD